MSTINKMPNTPEFAAMNSVLKRLSIAKSIKTSLQRSLNWLKVLQDEKTSQIGEFRMHISFCQVEVDYALAHNHTRDYNKNLSILNEIKWDKERYTDMRSELERKSERLAGELHEIEEEIAELEEMANKPDEEHGNESPPWI